MLNIGVKSEGFISIKNKVITEIARKINNGLIIARPKIEYHVQEEFFEAMAFNDTYQALFDESPGGLAGHFGLSQQAQYNIQKIIDVWLDSIKVTFTANAVNKKNFRLSASIKIQGILGDYSDVLSLQEAKTLNISNRYPGGQLLPWLEWLLTRGDEGIIQYFDILFGDFGSRSRSGTAIMVFSENKVWSVPSQFSGTRGNNFILEVIAATLLSKDLQQKILGEIDNAIK